MVNIYLQASYTVRMNLERRSEIPLECSIGNNGLPILKLHIEIAIGDDNRLGEPW